MLVGSDDMAENLKEESSSSKSRDRDLALERPCVWQNRTNTIYISNIKLVQQKSSEFVGEYMWGLQ